MKVLISGRTHQIQWKDIKLRIGHNEMSVPFVGIEPLESKTLWPESQIITKTTSALDSSTILLSSGVVAK